MTTKVFSNAAFISAKRMFPDISGACFSVLCLVHCIAMPLIAPMLIVRADVHDLMHDIIVAFAILCAAITIYSNQRQKLRWVIFVILTSGVVSMAVGEWIIIESSPTWLGPFSALMICGGHTISFISRRCAHPH